MKPEIKFGLILLILFVALFIFAHSIGPAISVNIDKKILGEGYQNLEDEKFNIFYYETDYSEARIQLEIWLLEEFITRFTTEMQAQGLIFPDFATKCTIYIMKTHEHLVEVATAKDLADMENNGGYFNPKKNSIAMVNLDRKGLYHELTHLLLHSAMFQNTKIKPWIDEAFAQYYETKERPLELTAVEELQSIEEIFKFTRADFSKQDNPRFYKASLYLLVFLLQEKKAQESVYKALKSELQNGTSVLDSELERNFGLEVLNLDFVDWYKNLK